MPKKNTRKAEVGEIFLLPLKDGTQVPLVILHRVELPHSSYHGCAIVTALHPEKKLNGPVMPISRDDYLLDPLHIGYAYFDKQAFIRDQTIRISSESIPENWILEITNSPVFRDYTYVAIPKDQVIFGADIGLIEASVTGVAGLCNRVYGALNLEKDWEYCCALEDQINRRYFPARKLRESTVNKHSICVFVDFAHSQFDESSIGYEETSELLSKLLEENGFGEWTGQGTYLNQDEEDIVEITFEVYKGKWPEAASAIRSIMENHGFTKYGLKGIHISFE